MSADNSGEESMGPSTDKDDKHQKHLALAGVVKGIHAKLRRKYRDTGDFTKVWDEHCQDQEALSSYATAMHHLAVDHWTQRPETRIDWCRNICHEYFLTEGLARARAKDERTKKHSRCSESSQTDEMGSSYEKSETDCQPEYAVSPHYPNYARHGPSESSEDLILPSSLPDHYACCLVQRPPAAHPLSLNIPRSTQNKKPYLSPVVPLSPINSVITPDSADIGRLRLPESNQQNPSEKCNDFMFKMDLPSPASQEQEQQERDRDFTLDKEAIYAKYGPVDYTSIILPFQGRIRLLDVGSCFNPFLKFDEFLAVGIDISPAVESVFHCDFLHLETPEPLQLARDTIDTILSTLTTPVTKLPRDSFHVVVFSLLLEYFPCAYQRWVCCQKAHALLMMDGLLLIITPDSTHQNKNVPMMKSWKRALEGMGFKRWKYVKQEHLHCMAYRKVSNETEHTLIGDTGPNMLYIPQDFSDCGSCCETQTSSMFSSIIRTEEETDFIRDSFSELPDLMD